MMFLANNPECNTARDICRIRGIKSGIASVTVEQLIGRGYLTRETDGKDRRMQRLYSTAEATPLVQAGQEAQRRFEEAIRQGLTDGELGDLCRTDTEAAGAYRPPEPGAKPVAGR